MKFSFEIQDITCGHCVAGVTAAVQGVDPEAETQVDLGLRRVDILTNTANADALAEALLDAGFTPVLLGPASA